MKALISLFSVIFLLAACGRDDKMTVTVPPEDTLNPRTLKNGKRNLSCKLLYGQSSESGIDAFEIKLIPNNPELKIFSRRFFESGYESAEVLNKSFSKSEDRLVLDFGFRGDFLSVSKKRKFTHTGTLYIRKKSDTDSFTDEVYDYSVILKLERQRGSSYRDQDRPRKRKIFEDVYICDDVKGQEQILTTNQEQELRNEVPVEMEEILANIPLRDGLFNPKFVDFRCAFKQALCFLDFDLMYPKGDLRKLVRELELESREERRRIRNILLARKGQLAGEGTCQIKGVPSYFALIDESAQGKTKRLSRKLRIQYKECLEEVDKRAKKELLGL